MLWSECKSLANGFLHRTDIVLDAIQPLALSDINLALVIQENEGIASFPLADSGYGGLFFGPLPTDYATVRSLSIGGRISDPVDIKTLREIDPGRRVYAISAMKVYATMSGQVDLLYTTRTPPALDSGSNMVLDRYPNVYLYAVLKHAAILAQDFDLQATYQAQFQEHVGLANSIYQNAAFGPGTTAVPVGGMF